MSENCEPNIDGTQVISLLDDPSKHPTNPNSLRVGSGKQAGKMQLRQKRTKKAARKAKKGVKDKAATAKSSEIRARKSLYLLREKGEAYQGTGSAGTSA
jgi:hypothetical protein